MPGKWSILYDYLLPELFIFPKHKFPFDRDPEFVSKQIENITYAKADIDANNYNQTVANIELGLSFFYKVCETDNMIAHTDDSQLVENLMLVYEFIHEWLGMKQVHAVELCSQREEPNLNGNLAVPIVSGKNEQEPSEDEDIVVIHGHSALGLQTTVEISKFLVKNSFMGHH